MSLKLELAPRDSNGVLAECTPSLMPFHISYSGHAPVARYFCPKLAPPLHSSSSATLVAVGSSSETNDGIASEIASSKLSTDVDKMDTDPNPVDTAAELTSDEQATQPIDIGLENAPKTNPTSRARFVAAFRGRQMYGQTVDVPLGYGGLVLRAPSETHEKQEDKIPSRSLAQKATRRPTRRSKRAAVDDVVDESDGADEDGCRESDVQSLPRAKKWTPSSTFDSFMLWTPDRPMDEGKDEYAMTMKEWVGLAAEIHSYDELEE